MRIQVDVRAKRQWSCATTILLERSRKRGLRGLGQLHTTVEKCARFSYPVDDGLACNAAWDGCAK